MATVRILAIDGGGIRGVIPAAVLVELEKRIAAKAGKAVALCDAFHMITGTSTGGIIACGLSKPGEPMTAEQLLALYRDHGGEIFSNPALVPAISPKYSPKELEKQLESALGDELLGNITRNDLLITSYDIERCDPFLFRSWRARGEELSPGRVKEEYNFLLRDVARATSAAPTYFPPAHFYNQRHGADAYDLFTLVDGGVFANNPAMCAVAAAKTLYPDQDNDYMIVSIGTGQSATALPYDRAKSWGWVGWAQPVIEVMFDGVADSTDYQLQQLLTDHDYNRFQISLGVPLPGNTTVAPAMDDASAENIKKLEQLAGLLIERNTARLDHVAETLVQPRDKIRRVSELELVG